MFATYKLEGPDNASDMRRVREVNIFPIYRLGRYDNAIVPHFLYKSLIHNLAASDMRRLRKYMFPIYRKGAHDNATVSH